MMDICHQEIVMKINIKKLGVISHGLELMAQMDDPIKSHWQG